MSAGPDKRSLGAASYEIKFLSNNAVEVRVWRDYSAGVLPTTAENVWRIVSDFGGLKRIFPSLLSVYVTYPDNSVGELNTTRHMTFAPADAQSPLSARNPLALGVEQLVQIDHQSRCLAYVSVLGLPVTDYRSVMKVTGDDACRLTWTSSFVVDAQHKDFTKVLATILAAGTNQIATALGLK